MVGLVGRSTHVALVCLLRCVSTGTASCSSDFPLTSLVVGIVGWTLAQALLLNFVCHSLMQLGATHTSGPRGRFRISKPGSYFEASFTGSLRPGSPERRGGDGPFSSQGRSPLAEYEQQRREIVGVFWKAKPRCAAGWDLFCIFSKPNPAAQTLGVFFGCF